MLIRSHAAIAMTALAGVLSGTLLSWAAEAQPSAYAGPAVTVVKARKACFADTIAVTGTIAAQKRLWSGPNGKACRFHWCWSNLETSCRRVRCWRGSFRPVRHQAPRRHRSRRRLAASSTRSVRPWEPTHRQRRIRFPNHCPRRVRADGGIVRQISVQALPRPDRQVNIVGIGEVAGQVRLVSTNINAMSRLGQVRVFLGANPSLRVGTFGRAIIVAGESCGSRHSAIGGALQRGWRRCCGGAQPANRNPASQDRTAV